MAEQLQNIGLALQGLGAGIQGQAPQFNQMLQNREVMIQEQNARRQALEIERQKSMFPAAQTALNLLEKENYDGLIRFGMQRTEVLSAMGADPVDTQRLTQLAIAARNGSDEARDLLKQELETTVEIGRGMGILETAKPDEFTLSPGQQRFSNGQVVAENTNVDPEEELERERLRLQLLDLEDRMSARQEDRAQREERANQATATQIRRIDQVILPEINSAIAEATDWATGRTGFITSLDPASQASLLKGRIESIKGNLGFDQLQAMRDSSPTGGALGQVSERELSFLQSTVANLNPNLGKERLQEQLEKVKRHYENWKMTLEGINPDEVGQPAEQAEARTISSEQEYKSLPAGARYIYEGVEYVKGQ